MYMLLDTDPLLRLEQASCCKKVFKMAPRSYQGTYGQRDHFQKKLRRQQFLTRRS